MKKECPLALCLNYIGDRWVLLILRNIFLGQSTFNEFVKSLGIARNILSKRLELLEENGILETEPNEEDLRSNRYVLTKKGQELGAVLASLRLWSEKWHDTDEVLGKLIDKESGSQIKSLHFGNSKGDILKPSRIQLVLSEKEHI